MKCVAEFDVTSEVSVSEEAARFSFDHPRGDFSFTTVRASVNEDEGLATLRCQMEFDSATVDAAEEIFLKHLIDALNFICLVTNARIEFHRLYKIFDWTPGLTMRRGLIFVHDPPKPEPQSFLTDEIAKSVELFLRSEINEQVASALRWFRFGVTADAPDDQFQKFWLSLELLAIHEKSTEKVNDHCPKCGGKLYCEECDEYPIHRPYPKQAIAHLCAKIAPKHPGFFEIANKARNAIMHGERLEDHEAEFGMPIPQLIDILGRIVWRALLTVIGRALPSEILPIQPVMGAASTYLKYKMGAAVILETVVPTAANGRPDFDKMGGITAEFVRGDPPES